MRCLNCKINIITFIDFIYKSQKVFCYRCNKKLFVINDIKIIKNEKVHILYLYSKILKKIIFDLKVNNDLKAGVNLITPFKKQLINKYKNYFIITAPSYYLSDFKRGFNHTKIIFKSLNLPVLDVCYKNKQYKQSEQSINGRRKIFDTISISYGSLITGKNILLVDDVMTTGNTLLSIKHKILKFKPKNIKLLVLSKKII